MQNVAQAAMRTVVAEPADAATALDAIAGSGGTTQTRVSAVDLQVNLTNAQTSSANNFALTTIVDTQAPVVTVTSPVGGESWSIGSVHNITWTATDNVTVASVDLALSTDGGATFPTAIATGIAEVIKIR